MDGAVLHPDLVGRTRRIPPPSRRAVAGADAGEVPEVDRDWVERGGAP